MRKARFTEHQIIAVIKSVEAGRTVKDVCHYACHGMERVIFSVFATGVAKEWFGFMNDQYKTHTFN